MCVTFLAIPDEGELLLRNYKLILWNNRDEDFERETSALAWRDGILAGRDERADERGTWLGIDEHGRIGNLLSITQPSQTLKKDAPSRGRLVNEFLTDGSAAADFLSTLSPKANEFNGFQMLTLEQIDGFYELYSMTNRLETTGPIHWPKGIYGFGNSPRSTPFQKVVYGERKFRELLERRFQTSTEWTEANLVGALFEMASDRTEHFPDEQIRMQTGAPEGSDLHRHLCSLFVNCHPKRYGTRSTSIILINSNDEVAFHERRVLDQLKPMDDPSKWEYASQHFRLKQ